MLCRRLRRVQVLNLSTNGLTAISYSIGQLTLLKELCLSKNRLQKLPESMANLTRLTSLNITNVRGP